MAVINLGPSRQSRIGARFGKGLSQGLAQAIEQARQERLRKQRVQQQYQDLVGLSQALQATKQRRQNQLENAATVKQIQQSGGPPQARQINQIQQPNRSQLGYMMNQYQPQTMSGVKLLQQLATQQMQPQYERGNPYVNDQGQRVVPIYQNGRLVRQERLGKVQRKRNPVTFSKRQKNRVLTRKAVPGTNQARLLTKNGFVQGSYEALPGAEAGGGVEPTGRSKEVKYWASKLGLPVNEKNANYILKNIVNPMYGRGMHEYEKEMWQSALEQAPETFSVNSNPSAKEIISRAKGLYDQMQTQGPQFGQKQQPEQGAPSQSQQQNDPVEQAVNNAWGGAGRYEDEDGNTRYINNKDELRQWMVE